MLSRSISLPEAPLAMLGALMAAVVATPAAATGTQTTGAKVAFHEFKGPSYLKESSCIENQDLKVCFDDSVAGTISGVYNKRANPARNLILPTMGGAFQVALRSYDPITPCPGKSITWGAVWNPTEAGCEQCFLVNDEWWHSASQGSVSSRSATSYAASSRPRNFFHHNANDCHSQLPYTEGPLLGEDIALEKKASADADSIEITWSVKHTGSDSHRTNPLKWHRHELPTLYLNSLPECFHITYEDKTGAVKTEPLPCGTGQLKALPQHGGWVSLFNPKKPEEAMTLVVKTSLADNTTVFASVRSYDKATQGIQLSFQPEFNISPSLAFTTVVHVLPYRYGETLRSGRKVKDFIDRKQSTNLRGSARYYGKCASVTGWATHGATGTVGSVKIFDNNELLGEVPARRAWDSTVGQHGFQFAPGFAPGEHSVRVLAEDPVTHNHRELEGSPLSFTCPASEVTGYARYPGGCREITGWASNSSFTLDVTQVRIYDNDELWGEVPANLPWDATVRQHKFSLVKALAPGKHRVTVMALDPGTGSFVPLKDSPLVFTCP